MAIVALPQPAGEAGRVKTLYQLLVALSRASTLEGVYDAALSSLIEATAADGAAILLFDDDGVMRFKASRGLSREYQTAVTGHSPWPRGSRDAQPLVVTDILLDESLAAHREAILREGFRALVFVPLALDAGVFGKFMLYYTGRHDCTADELDIAAAIAAHVALATEQKRAQLAWIRSEQRLQAIVDNSATVIFLKDLQGRYQLVNWRYEELFHVTKENVAGRTDYDLFSAEIAEQFQANDRAALAAGEPIAIEEWVQQDDGIHSYISVKFPLHEPGGGVTGVCGIATDITERKRLEAASRHLAAVVENSDDAIVSKDSNGIITSWNRGAERIFGYTADEIVGKPVSILAAPDRLNEMPEILSKVLRGSRVDHYETRRRRKDGQIIDVALTVSPVRDTGGRIVGASKIARDITRQKRAEQERTLLLSREQEARRSAELLNRVASCLSAQLDVGKLVQEVTDLATDLVGAEFGALFHNLSNEKGGSRAPYALSGVPREEFNALPLSRGTDLWTVFEGATVVRCDDATQDPRHGEIWPRDGMPAGLPPVRSYLAAPVIARSGEVLGGLFFGHSAAGKFTGTHETVITGIAAQAAIAMDNARLFEQAQWAQAELKRSNEVLRRANEDLEIFAYSASHDLKEPLRNISLSAEMIGRGWGPGLGAEPARFLGNILAATRSMNVLIEDLLAYTKSTKYAEGAPPNADPARVLASVLETLRSPIEEAGATVTAGTLPTVAIHESRLAQLFQNLIGNAIKYRGKEVPRVHVTADERDGWCVFSVVDNGIGIEAQYAEQIFGLFKRLHGREEYPGSGIGLALCQRVVEQYGGRIWLERSTPGGGSTFSFALPSRTR